MSVPSLDSYVARRITVPNVRSIYCGNVAGEPVVPSRTASENFTITLILPPAAAESLPVVMSTDETEGPVVLSVKEKGSDREG